MIKIDFHIHTKQAANNDQPFVFSIDKLDEYIRVRDLNAIAITNHNLFDDTNFDIISNHVSIPVFPGIEIDLEKGHILVIGKLNDKLKMKLASDELSKIINNVRTYISFEEFANIFKNFSDFLFIPHYDKKPRIQEYIIRRFNTHIFCGEVHNANKFVRHIKSDDKITPLLFSDVRICDDIKLPLRQTYIDVSDINLDSIKEALRDKTKVYLNKERNNELFQILDNGTNASYGLNVIIGKRSSGKTYTLNKIFDNFGPSIKYIKQFQLVEDTNEEKAQKEFEKSISSDKVLFVNEYLKEFEFVVNDITSINLSDFLTETKNYLDCLIQYANEQENLDIFANVPLFREQEFVLISDNEIKKLIDSVILLLEENKYSYLIKKNIKKEYLVALLADLIGEYKKTKLNEYSLNEANKILEQIKSELNDESANNVIPNLPIVDYATNIIKIDSFNFIVNKLKENDEIISENVGKFKIIAKKREFNSISEIKEIIKTKVSLDDIYQSYNNPYEYLKKIKDNSGLLNSDIYKFYIYIEYSVLNQYNLPVSGGERSEFKLINLLKDTNNFDMLLIDEPESSFDNVFLKDEIILKIKQLSSTMPVFISTHNNVIGASIKADHYLFTKREIIDNEPHFYIFGGNSTSKKLVNNEKKSINNYDVLMDCLEGTEESYNERSTTYENIKNR